MERYKKFEDKGTGIVSVSIIIIIIILKTICNHGLYFDDYSLRIRVFSCLFSIFFPSILCIFFFVIFSLQLFRFEKCKTHRFWPIFPSFLLNFPPQNPIFDLFFFVPQNSPFLPKTLRFSPMLIVIFALRLPFLALFFALHAVFSALFWAIIPFSGVRRIFYRWLAVFFRRFRAFFGVFGAKNMLFFIFEEHFGKWKKNENEFKTLYWKKRFKNNDYRKQNSRKTDVFICKIAFRTRFSQIHGLIFPRRRSFHARRDSLYVCAHFHFFFFFCTKKNLQKHIKNGPFPSIFSHSQPPKSRWNWFLHRKRPKMRLFRLKTAIFYPCSALFSAFFCRAPPNLCKIADPIRVVKSKKRAEFEEISGDPR
jgi:hypothetical protein